jgi:HSP20 family protein
MRYRRLSYRYAVVMATSRSRAFGDAWPRQAPSVGLAHPWRPATDVVETGTEVVVTVELAGVDHEELDVLLFEDALIVDGERRLPPAHAAGVFHVAEIQQGQFHLEIPLPATIDPDQVDARYERGLLEMRFVKRAVSRTSATSIPISQVVDGAAIEITPPDVTATSLPSAHPAHADRPPTRHQRDDDGS